MSEPFLGEIRMFSSNFAPHGWARCEGQLFSIEENKSLFKLLGTYYGGDGVTTFALPDLRGRVPIHASASYPHSDAKGEETHSLTIDEMPRHTHQAVASLNPADVIAPEGNTWASSNALFPFSTTTIFTPMNSVSLTTTGEGSAHSNIQPYLVMNYCIATKGIFQKRK